MYIERQISPLLTKIAQQFPVIALMGSFQSGKTTLARTLFNQHYYVSLEDLDKRLQAREDPRKFLEEHSNAHGVIFDEIQHVPEILSYIQTNVDQQRRPGYFIITGSQNFLVNQAITQTLAGRMAVLTLLPLSIAELKQAAVLPLKIEEFVFKGAYPGLYAHEVMIPLWYSSYITTYIERDIRQVATIGDLAIFKLFTGLTHRYLQRSDLIA
jgi:predicted AAA+ superfamily ATPase